MSFALWNKKDDVVFGPAAAPTTWNELDLSGIVGEQRALVLIHIHPSTGNDRVSFRPNGDSADYAIGAGSCSSVLYNSSSSGSSVLVLTDNSGKVQWISGAASTVTLTVVGYISNPGYGIGTNVSTGALSATSWNTIDCSGIVGERKALILLKITSTIAWNANEYWITRKHGDADNWVDTSIYAYAFANKTRGIGDAKVSTLLVTSNSSGEIEIYSALGTGTADVEVMAYMPLNIGWNIPDDSGIVFEPDTAPSSFTDLDLSSVIGKNSSLVLLKVDKISGSIAGVTCRFRENGRSWAINAGNTSPQASTTISNRTAFVIVPTDSNGIVEWDIEAPYGTHVYEISVVGWLSSSLPQSSTTVDLTSLRHGKIVAFLEIPGFGVLSTDDYVPYDGWFQDNYTTDYLYPLLQFDFSEYREEIDYTKAELQISGMRCSVVNIENAFNEKLKSYKVRASTRLTSSVSAGDAVFSCTYVGDFLSTGMAFIGQECVERNGITDNKLSVVRAQLGTQADDYNVDLSSMPPVQPVLTDGIETLTGRRAILHFAVLDEVLDLLGPTVVVYRGEIKKGSRRKGANIEIPLEHVWNTTKKNIGSRMPNSQIINGQYWYSGNFDPGLSGFNIRRYNYTTADEETGPIIIPAGYYNFTSLLNAVRDAFNSSGLGREVDISVGIGELILLADDQSGYTWDLWIREGSPLWALGFEAGHYQSARGGTLEIHSVKNYMRNYVIDWQSRTGYSNSPKIQVADITGFVVGTYAAPSKSGYAKIKALSADTNMVHFYSNSFDASYDDVGFWSKAGDNRTKEEQDVLQSVFAFGGNLAVCRLSTALKRMLGMNVSGYNEPASWCAKGILSSDIDFDSLDDAVDGLPSALRYFDHCVDKGKQVWGLIGPQLALLGICPRCGDNNVIEFTRINTPMELLAETVEVDEEIWELTEAAETETKDDDAPLLNLIEINHSLNYTEGKDGEYGRPIKIYNDDNLHVFGETRKVTYDCPGLRPHVYGVSVFEFAEICRQETIGTHFGIWGRSGYTTDISVTWPGKQVKCGEFRKVTHECVHDIDAGEVGVESKIGLVVSRTWRFSGSGSDMVGIRISPPVNVGGIAPCALMTGYVASTATGTFTANPLFSDTDDDDLTPFHNLDVSTVLLSPRNSDTFASYQAIISSMDRDTREVEFAADVLSTNWGSYSASGMYMTFSVWNTLTSAMKVYAYVADLSTNPTLGSSEEDPFEWSI